MGGWQLYQRQGRGLLQEGDGSGHLHCAHSGSARQVRRLHGSRFPDSGRIIGGVTIQAAPGRSAVFALSLFFHMTIPAQGVELGFDQGADFRVRFVALETQALAGLIDEIVMTGHAVDAAVIQMGEGDREHGPLGPQPLLTFAGEPAEPNQYRSGSHPDQQAAHARAFTWA